MKYDGMDMPETTEQAEMLMWGAMLRGDSGRLSKEESKLAAIRFLEVMGIAEQLRAISSDGILRVPPKWPELDIRCVGGGPSFVTVEFRTIAPSGGMLTVGARIPYKGKGKNADAIGEATEKARKYLHDKIHGGIRSVVPR